MKYQILPPEDLENLREEFVSFLILHGIDAMAWETIKTVDPAKAAQMVGAFSDQIYDQVLDRAQFVTVLTPNSIFSFHFQATEVVLVALESSVTLPNVDLLADFAATHAEHIRVYTTKKPYQKERRLEIYELLNQGGKLDHGHWYKTLCLLLPQKMS